MFGLLQAMFFDKQQQQQQANSAAHGNQQTTKTADQLAREKLKSTGLAATDKNVSAATPLITDKAKVTKYGS